MTTRAGDVPGQAGRPSVEGKFVYLGGEKLWVRGVTYGTFRPDVGGPHGRPERVERDFARYLDAVYPQGGSSSLFAQVVLKIVGF